MLLQEYQSEIPVVKRIAASDTTLADHPRMHGSMGLLQQWLKIGRFRLHVVVP